MFAESYTCSKLTLSDVVQKSISETTDNVVCCGKTVSKMPMAIQDVARHFYVALNLIPPDRDNAGSIRMQRQMPDIDIATKLNITPTGGRCEQRYLDRIIFFEGLGHYTAYIWMGATTSTNKKKGWYFYDGLNMTTNGRPVYN